jgi:hypothetical protein
MPLYMEVVITFRFGGLNDEVQKVILTPNYVKISFIFPNLIRLKFMLKVLRKQS